MAIGRVIFQDSFDHYDTAAVATKWTQLASATAGGGTTGVGAFGRRGTNGFQFQNTLWGIAERSAFLKITPDKPVPSGARCVFGVAFRPVTAFAGLDTGATKSVVMMILQGGGIQLQVCLNTNGTLTVYRGTTSLGTTSIALQQNVYRSIVLDALIDPSAGEIRLYIDEAPALLLSGVNTRGTSSSTWDELQIGHINAGGTQTQTWQYDDVYVLDGSGGETTITEDLDASEDEIEVDDISVFPTDGPFRVRIDDELILVPAGGVAPGTPDKLQNVTRGYGLSTAATHSNGAAITMQCSQGDQRIDYRPLNANGANRDFTPSTGTDDFAVVDEAAANGDTDYLEASGVGDKVTGGVADAPVPGATITSMQVVAQARKTDAGSAGHKAVVRLGGTDYLGAEYGLTSSFAFQRECFRVKPDDDAPWEEADFNGCEPGAQKSS